MLNDNGDNIAPKSNITPFAHEAHRGPRISLGRYKGDGTNHGRARIDTEKHGNMRDRSSCSLRSRNLKNLIAKRLVAYRVLRNRLQPLALAMLVR